MGLKHMVVVWRNKMKDRALFFIGLVLSIFLVSACSIEQQPTILPGNQINETVLTDIVVNETVVNEPVIVENKTEGVVLPLISITYANGTVVNQTPGIETKINKTLNMS